MINCSECPYCVRGPNGQMRFSCDPFTTIREPECIAKWQLIKLDMLVQAYQATLAMYHKLAPMQEKMFRHLEREIDDVDEADKWKQAIDEDKNDDKDQEENNNDENKWR